jgi:hypothetical protein
MTPYGRGTSVAAPSGGPTVEATMSDQKQKDPNPREWNNRMTSEAERRPSSPAATGADPQAQAAQQPGGGAPGTGQDVEMSEEAKNQWAGAKGPTESGKP